MQQEIEIFVSYSRQDEQLANELKAELSPLEEQNPSVYIWSVADIIPGTEWTQAIHEHLERAQIVLPLISPDFMTSKELSLIGAKQKAGTALIIPILLRPTGLRHSFIANLKLLPANGKPLTKWQSRGLAYLEIVDEVKVAIETLKSPTPDEEKQLRKLLETFSERELFSLSMNFGLNINVLLEEPPRKGVGGFPRISADRLLQYMGQQGRLKDLADYIRKKRSTSNENREDIA